MKKQLFRGLMIGVLTTMSMGGSTLAQAADGTASLDLTVDANITSGTCSATVMDGEIATNTIVIGDNIAASEVLQGSRIKPFKIRFSNCAGLPESTATLTLKRRSGSCAGSDGPAFRNQGGSSAGIGLEVWTTEEPNGSDSVQLVCNAPNAQAIDISTARNAANLDYKMSARLIDVTSAGKISVGTFTTPTVFTVSYK
ncbi:fimbrial protein [Salmonella enterica subsp. enterica serovar Muenchen]|nr:fimbrial protein [Salmonella enterica subsp. enterica serovar Muenchen]